MRLNSFTSFKNNFSFLGALLLAAFGLVPSVSRGGLTFELHIQRYNGGYLFYNELRTNSTTPAAPLGMYFFSSPGQPTNGASRQFFVSATNIDYVDSSTYGYNTFTDLMQQMTNGPWSILVTNATSTNLYKFNITASSFASNAVPAVNIAFPMDGAIHVTNQPTFTWQTPPGWVGSLYAEDFQYDTNGNSTFFDYADLPVTQNSWNPPDTLLSGDQTFLIQYTATNTSMAASTPVKTNSAQVLSGWLSEFHVEDVASVNFSVGTPGVPGSGHTNVAHYNFDDGTRFTHDVSGNGNDINSYSTSGGDYSITNDAKAGPFAASFAYDHGLGAAWFSPPTNLLATFASSFSVSLWLKSTEFFGTDSDSGELGEGIVTVSLGGDQTKNVIPMSMTGHKLAFLTGGNPYQTLHSVSDINTGAYVHLVVTRDQGTGEKKIYVNGVLDASAFGTSAALNGGTEIDVGVNYNTRGLNAHVDDIQFYAGVLSASEISNLFANPGTAIANVTGGPSLASALNTTNLTWTTTGNASWFGQTTNTHDGISAAQSGRLAQNQSSILQTTINGPGTLTFWWGTLANDFEFDLEFDVDGSYNDDINGNQTWTQKTVVLGAGSHTLTWTALANNATDQTDAGFVDQVVFDGGQGPVISLNPFNQTNHPGYSVALLANASGNPTPNWQWFKVGNSLPIPNATNALFIPTNSGLASVAGNYYAVASNPSGSATSLTATVTFVNAALPPDWSRAFRSPLFNTNNGALDDYALACRTDSTGNLYTAISYTGTNNVGTNTLVSANGAFETAIIKQSATGAAIWARGITNNGNGNSNPQSVAPAPGDGIYVAGNFFGTNWIGTNKMVDVGNASIYLARFDSAGSNVWVRTITGTNFVFTGYNALVADPQGNVTLSGLIQGSVSLGATNIAVTGQQGLVVQYDANGAVRWLSLPSGNVVNMTYNSGRLYASFFSSITNAYIGGVTNVTDRQYSIASLNYTNGQASWVRGIGAANGVGNPLGLIDDEPLLAVSGSNVFIMGTAFGSNATFGPFTVSFPGGAGQYFARYNTNGTPQLAVGFGSPTTIPWTTLADSSGNVYVGGDFDTYSVFGSNLIAAPHQDSIGNGYSSQGFLAKFDANGNPLWARLAQSQNNYVNVRGLTLANDGVWGCGLFKSPTSFGTNTIFSASSCVGSPTCFLTYHVSGFLAKITDATVVSNPAITLVNPQVSGVNFQFQFLSQTGKTHLVLSRTNIVLGNWVTNSTISGDGTIKTVSVPKASPKETYFRVFTP